MRKPSWLVLALAAPLLWLSACGSSKPSDGGPGDPPVDPPPPSPNGALPPLTGFRVAPYLQSPGTDRMTVMFEPEPTSLAEVEYRPLGEAASQTTAAAVEPVQRNSTGTIDTEAAPYTARLGGLRSNTTYEYRVRTDAGATPWLRFKTWPAAGDGVDTGRFVVISDTQGNNPEWLRLIMEEGLIPKDCEGDVHVCVERIHGIVIPGDIVNDGEDLNQWRAEFFGKGRSGFAYIPVIPAIGNHDYDLKHYLIYFDLPDNGSPLHREEWYRLDFLNLRLLTLQTNLNDPTLLAEQTAWFTREVQAAGGDAGPDYLFMQMHHPCKSEFWIPGENPLTCVFRKQLEQVSADTGRISGHFFGHTHAYSRGQSRDVPHLWLNAASGSGNIDNWGEFEQADYDEFESSWDEYGYSLVEFATAGTPEIRSVRRSGGSDGIDYEQAFGERYVRDVFVIGGDNRAPGIPVPAAPAGTVASADVILHARYQDADGDPLHEAHWQLRQGMGTYDRPLLEQWGNESRAHNIWFRQDLNAGIDVDYWRVPYLPVGSYCWRVRYRDPRLAWSPWSEEGCFEVAGTVEGADRVVNGGAESGTEGWTVTEGTLESVFPLQCSPAGESLGFDSDEMAELLVEGALTSFVALPAQGLRYFAVGGCAEVSDRARAVQGVDVSDSATAIDAGEVLGVLRARLRTFTDYDVPTARFRAYGADDALLGEAKPLIHQSGSWADKATSLRLPAGTRRVEIEIGGVKQDGAVNDSFVDDVRFHLVTQSGPELRTARGLAPVLSPGNGMALIPKQADFEAWQQARKTSDRQR